MLTVPAALAQIGEFSFILAAVARDLRVLPEVGLNIVVAVSIASILLNPLAAKAIRPAEASLARWRLFRKRGIAETLVERGEASSLQPDDRAVVVGYGPTGRTVARLLKENGISADGHRTEHGYRPGAAAGRAVCRVWGRARPQYAGGGGDPACVDVDHQRCRYGRA